MARATINRDNYAISNIKISCLIVIKDANLLLLYSEEKDVKHFGNFVVVRRNNFVYSIFKKRKIGGRKEWEKRMREKMFNPERFPGMFISFPNNTLLIFSSRKMVVIGGGSERVNLQTIDGMVNFLNARRLKNEFANAYINVDFLYKGSHLPAVNHHLPNTHVF